MARKSLETRIKKLGAKGFGEFMAKISKLGAAKRKITKKHVH